MDMEYRPGLLGLGAGAMARLQRSPYQDATALQELLADTGETSRTPSFFEPKLPKGVASQRKLHHMMDVLRPLV